MSTGVLDLAESFSRQLRTHGTRWCGLLRQSGVAHGIQQTHSLNSLVTDSAAASSAWGCGLRVPNGMLNCFEDGTKATPIGKIFQQRGSAFGLVTTATITHATPAGFAVTNPNRRDEDAIAAQYLELEPDLLLGGGSKFFFADTRTDGRDLAGEFAAAGYHIAADKRQIQAGMDAAKLLGLFARDHLPYTIDHRADPDLQKKVPTLAEMAGLALRRLSANARGFLCQIEGARIDHAAHNNDAAGLLWDQLAFDDAVGVALDFAAEDGGTLVLVTSDHGNANPGLNGWGAGYTASPAHFEQTAKASRSFEFIQNWMRRQLDGNASIPRAQFCREMEGMLGFCPDKQEQEVLEQALTAGTAPNWNRQLQGFVGLLGQIAGNRNGIGWTGTTHTSDHVLSTAFGPGSEAFAGLLRNDQVFEKICDLFEIDFRNQPPKPTPQTSA